jgi:hypothetical protein
LSDVSQGPGWWLASDGKWYSPEQVPGPVTQAPSVPGGFVPTSFPADDPGTPTAPFAPYSPSAYVTPPGGGYGPPPAAPGYGPAGAPGYAYPNYGYMPVQNMNGLAVASLVCSLLWVFGLGAALAILFGFIARSQIKLSGGAQRGKGLALAGIIIGLAGLLTVALFVTVGVIVAHKCNQTGNCTFNTTLNNGT